MMLYRDWSQIRRFSGSLGKNLGKVPKSAPFKSQKPSWIRASVPGGPADYQSVGLFRVNLYRQNLIRFSLYFRQREYVSRYPLEIYFFLPTMNQICISLFQRVEIAFPIWLFLVIK